MYWVANKAYRGARNRPLGAVDQFAFNEPVAGFAFLVNKDPQWPEGRFQLLHETLRPPP